MQVKILFLIFIILITQTAFPYSKTYIKHGGTGDGTSWENALPADSLQWAFMNAPGTELWIGKGVYKPVWQNYPTDDPRDRHFRITEPWDIYGGFEGWETDISQRDLKNNQTVLSGDIGVEGDNSDNCYHVIRAFCGFLDGLVIQDGNADGTDESWSGSNNSYGGGVLQLDWDLTIRNCIFRNNYAKVGGGLMNYANSRFETIVENCLFYNNTASLTGGGIYSSGRSIVLTNNTIVNNYSPGVYGIHLSYHEEISQVYNNLIWNNNKSKNAFISSSKANSKYRFNAIIGWEYGGLGNINLSAYNTGDEYSPYFTDPVKNDYSLQPQSALIDAGVFWNTPDVDITNMASPKGECRDIGAYEYDSGSLTSTLPQISTLNPEFVSLTSARIRGDVKSDGNTRMIAKGVIFSDKPGFDPSTEGTIIKYNGYYEPGVFYCDITGLTTNTTYYYRAYCENMYGSAMGDEMSFTTNAGISPDAEGRLYVTETGTGSGLGSSWMSSLNGNDLQLAIEHPDVKEIWLAAGTYKPTSWPCSDIVVSKNMNDGSFKKDLYKYEEFAGEDNNKEYELNGTRDRERHFMLSPGVTIYGGFTGNETSLDQRDFRANETILSGDIGTEGYDADNAYHVIYHFYNPEIDSTAVIDGLIIQDGKADYQIDNHSGMGGGMFNYYSSPTIKNCVFRNNNAVWGGGMFNYYSEGEGRSKPSLYKTEFYENHAKSAGGGIYNNTASPKIVNCTLTNNKSNSGGGIFHYSFYTGTFLDESQFNIIHSTIAGNTADEGTQISLASEMDNKINIYNSIIWGSGRAIQEYETFISGSVVPIDEFLFININYSAVCGGFEDYYHDQGVMNINLSEINQGYENSPYFVDPVNNNYNLSNESPCRDMAIYKYGTEYDILYVQRPQGKAYDMGAYEYISSDLNASPPEIETSNTENITASTALCNTNIISTGGTPIVERGIIIDDYSGFDPEYSGELYSKIGNYYENSYSKLVTDISSNTKYYYCSYAQNRMGYSYGQKKEFTTMQILPDNNGIFYIKENGNSNGSSWDNALNGKDVQAAIEHKNSKELWIAKGTYMPNSWPQGGRDLKKSEHYSLTDGIKLYGGFNGTETNINERDVTLNKTIFSGDIGIENDSTDNSSHIFINIKITDPALIDGFIFTDGYENIQSLNNINNWYWGGAAIHNVDSNIKIKNSVFQNNFSKDDVGVIKNNTTPTPENKCYFEIENCDFIDNTGGITGVLDINGNYKTTLRNCRFLNNAGNGTGTLDVYNTDRYTVTKLYNCLFANNHSYNGPCIDLAYSDNFDELSEIMKIINCTIVNNTGIGGLDITNMSEKEHFIDMANNVIFNNELIQIYVYDFQYNNIPNISNCAVEGEIDFEYSGANNIILSSNNSGDPNSPYFSDPDRNHWWAQEHSPLVDAGIWTDDVPLYDLAGYERDETPDIGCYEYDPSSIEDGESSLPVTTELYQNYPNPFNPTTNIKFSIAKAGKVELTVHNVLGQVVTKLVESDFKAGNHSVVFNADAFNSGIYYYTLEADGKSLTKRMLMIK